MKSIYLQLTGTSGLFKRIELTDENEIAITTGCTYDDQTELILYLVQGDGAIILTDNGRTRTFVDKKFELTAPDVIKNILEISSYYGISTKNQQLSLRIENVGESLKEGILKMIFCIGFLNAMKIFYTI